MCCVFVCTQWQNFLDNWWYRYSRWCLLDTYFQTDLSMKIKYLSLMQILVKNCIRIVSWNFHLVKVCILLCILQKVKYRLLRMLSLLNFLNLLVSYHWLHMKLFSFYVLHKRKVLFYYSDASTQSENPNSHFTCQKRK